HAPPRGRLRQRQVLVRPRPPAYGLLGLGGSGGEPRTRRRRGAGVADARPVGPRRVHRPVRGVRDRTSEFDVAVRVLAATRMAVIVRPLLPAGLRHRRRVLTVTPLVVNGPYLAIVPPPGAMPTALRGHGGASMPTQSRGHGTRAPHQI